MRAACIYFWIIRNTCFNLIIQFLKALCYRDQTSTAKHSSVIFLHWTHKLCDIGLELDAILNSQIQNEQDDALLLKSMMHFMLLIFTAILKQAGIVITASFIIGESTGLRPNQDQ